MYKKKCTIKPIIILTSHASEKRKAAKPARKTKKRKVDLKYRAGDSRSSRTG